MALPFQVFDPDYADFFAAHVWCVRCEDWIPIEEAYGVGMGHDPHVYDHVEVWLTFRQLGGDNPFEPPQS